MAVTQPSDGTGLRELSNEELALRAQAGARDCFEELVRRFEGRLLGYLRRCRGQGQEAEDLLQDTFVRAYHRIERYDAKWRFSTWIFTIARRLMCDRGRRPERESLERAEGLATDQDTPLRIVSAKEEKENLWSLAEALLGEDQYTALWLRYGEDMSIREIARVMSKSRSYVKVLLYRARNRMAGNLKPGAIDTPPAMPKPRVGAGGL